MSDKHTPVVTPQMLPQLHLHGFVSKDAASAKGRQGRDLQFDLGRNATPDQLEAYIDGLPPVYQDSVPKRPDAGNITEAKQAVITLADRISTAAARQALVTPRPAQSSLKEHLQRFVQAPPDIAGLAATTALTATAVSANEFYVKEAVRLAIIDKLTAKLTPAELNQFLEQQRLDYITTGLISGDQPEDLAKTDLASDLNLTKFIIGLDFSNNIEPPYSDCTVTLKIPSALLHYLFHGRLKQVAHASAGERVAASRVPSPRTSGGVQQGADRQPISTTTGFRYIEAGGWMSLRVPVDKQGSDNFVTKQHQGDTRTLFFGKIHSLNVTTVMDSNSIFDTTVVIRCYSFIYPYTVAQFRTTPQRLGQMTKVDPVALAQSGTGDTDKNPHAEAFQQWIKGTQSWQVDESTRQRALRAGQPDPKENPTERPLGQILRYMVESLGYFHLPNSIAGDKTVGGVTGYHRLGDHIMVIGDNVDNMSWTALGQNFDELDVIKGEPRPSYLVKSMQAPADNVTLWQEIRTAVQPENMDRLIELFPMLVPVEALKNTGAIEQRFSKEESAARARATAAGNPPEAPKKLPTITRTSKGDDALKKIANSSLVTNLGAVPCLVYRWRPLPPKFDLTKNSLLSANHMQAGFEEIVGYEKVFGEVYFGRPTDTDGDTEKYNSSSKWLDINPGMVVKTEISWTEHTRVNAVHCQPHHSSQNTNQVVQPFGVLSVPLFDPLDINRHGMRMRMFQTPFYRHQMGNIRSDTAAEIAASAISERFYYSFGDGHAYGSGTITLAYTPLPNLVCGQWIRIDFDKVMGKPATHEIDRVPLTAYCTAVRHIASIDQRTGLPDAMTVLSVERVSYGNRVPKIKHNAVGVQQGRRPAQQTARRDDKRRPGTRGGR